MRDIRDDLRERLQGIDAQRDGLRKSLEALDSEREIVLKMLEFETKRHAYSAQGALTPEARSAALKAAVAKLADNAIQLSSRPILTLVEGLLEKGAYTKDELRAEAETAGMFTGNEAPGRIIHAMVMNLERHGRIRQRADGKYEKIPAAERPGMLLTAD